ncbi:hypothetical protein BO78DRAFT_401324 [Aspergillus sclerotiicarbonarius CBS 121057]|uniref:Uncharacterized protein n=1 Tax=Aspergillus sclerotiicarbonarius (strain CBS 121057 / IBT 28362) TaxID=1448318 RepID=A0A319DUJ3_ASPSB|nr:hypothetical protein BO78DRAFT_401324 [Aspergillus sclerotiicarbonarius CBS 121057]
MDHDEMMGPLPGAPTGARETTPTQRTLWKGRIDSESRFWWCGQPIEAQRLASGVEP